MIRTRIAIADDHAVVREGLRTLLGAQPDFEIVGESGTADETIECVRKARPEVLTLDLSMPGWGGSTVAPIAEVSPATRIVVYTMHDDPVFVRTMLASGVIAYVLKSSPTSTLLEAIRAAATSQMTVDPKLSFAGEPRKGTVAELSRREREVLELLVRGMTHQEIADQLFVSVKSIETYLARVREKTGLKSRAELTQYGMNVGLMTSTPPPRSEK